MSNFDPLPTLIWDVINGRSLMYHDCVYIHRPYAKSDPFQTEFWSEFLKNSVVILRNLNTMKLIIFGIFFDFLAVFSAACPACFWKFKQLAEAAGERGITTGPTVSSAKCCFTLTNFPAAPSNNFSLTALLYISM